MADCERKISLGGEFLAGRCCEMVNDMSDDYFPLLEKNYCISLQTCSRYHADLWTETCHHHKYYGKSVNERPNFERQIDTSKVILHGHSIPVPSLVLQSKKG